jgi:DNA-binding beta-propeller fold protein YncE
LAVGVGLAGLAAGRLLLPAPVLIAGAAGTAERRKAPELVGGVAWLNTAGPLKLSDLRGKIVLLDFWTYCCINCIHTLPDLAKLERKYEKELVVIGVHSAKFDNEKNTDAIRKAILRYQIAHPVVNDADMKIWNSYGVNSWPTLALIDPDGNVVRGYAGEGNYEDVDRDVAQLIAEFDKKGTLDRKPMRFDLARDREKGDTPLFFPGKVLADAASNRLFIADSTHHRVVVTDLAGNKVAIAGAGTAGWKDGSFAQAQFDDPQGMALDGQTLYVADRKNHLIRALDLKAGTVTTVAGTGSQDRDNRSRGGPAMRVGLNSPWDLILVDRVLYVAMAGHHQIWKFDLGTGMITLHAGTGREDIRDGPLGRSALAQPSGLAYDGKRLYVADSEASAVRTVDLEPGGSVRTLVGLAGQALFNFGDVDGVGDQVRLQHALGVVFHGGRVYVADTYNSKIKIIDPAKASCETWLGGGKGPGWLADPLFNEPAGLSVAGAKLYVADTNAHRIRVVDLKTKAVSTLPLVGVEPPADTAAAPLPMGSAK